MIYIPKFREQNFLGGNKAIPLVRKPLHNRRLSPIG